MRLINNRDALLSDELKLAIRPDCEVLICVCYTSINAVFSLIEEFKEAGKISLLLDTDIDLDQRFSYDSQEWSQYLELKGKFKAEQVRHLVETKFEVRQGKAGGQKFILVKNKEQSHCFSIVPQDLNLLSLGLMPSPSPIIISTFEDVGGQYYGLFKQFWGLSNKDLKTQLLTQLANAARYFSPDHLYKFSLYNIFQNKIIDEATEQRIDKIGFKQTLIWSMLYNFQQDAVLGAIDKIETFGGCIIADSVGLGKTFEALAIMKYYQMRNDRVLLLCPKKLRDNWMIYSQNDVRNILAKDRFNFDVLNHTDLSRDGGYSGDINLATVNWGNYDLIVIDESHNFRNNPPRRDGVTRYQRLMEDVIRSGVKTKVLMLSATPVNTRMNDIKNQISFITEQNDSAFENFGIASIDQTLRRAQQRFNVWLRSRNGTDFSRDSLIDSLDGSYFKILDLLTIARSRKHIQKYYDTKAIGKFPERLRPITKCSDFDKNGTFPKIDKVNNELNALNLNFYSPLSYVRADKKQRYEDKYDITTANGSIFRQIERESSLIHLMRVNLLKRLESSVHSFQLTLESLLRQINSLLGKIEQADANNGLFDADLDINEVDFDDELLADLLVGGKIKVLLQDMDLIRCKEDLLDDHKRITNLIGQTKVIDPERDAKLADLKHLIGEKANHPLNGNNKKVIIFSAYADTVKYLYEQLSSWILKDLGLCSALVTGGDNNRTNLNGAKADLISILTNFSPVSKQKATTGVVNVGEIDILFCTDCISEGQNLQDCDFLINYDIHWNPVRIIQRFGRIDRIGSKNERIQLVNFFPNVDLDNYIDLIGRVKGRMQILDVSATGDDNIIDDHANQNQDLEYRKRQLNQLKDQVLDLEDIDGGISITDLTFNDFKIDADRLEYHEKEFFATLPKAIGAVTTANLDDAHAGVIFCLRDVDANLEDAYANNAIFPYNLCYVNKSGEIFIPGNHPKRCLDYFKKLSLGKKEMFPALLADFERETANGKRMQLYTDLLQVAMAHISGVGEETGLDSLATPGGTKLRKTFAGNRYELISFLVIK